MSEDEMRKVRRALLALITGAEQGTGPTFLGFAHKPGWILVTCENDFSREWLVDKVKDLKPWPEAELSCMSEEQLPKPSIATTFLPNTEADTVEEALKLIRAQNAGLNTEHWKVLHAREDKGGQVVTFSLDDPSAETLKESECRAALGFRKINFKIKGVSEGSAAASGQQPTQTSGPVRPGTSGISKTPQRPAAPTTTFRGKGPTSRNVSGPLRGGNDQSRANSGRGRKHPYQKTDRPKPSTSGGIQ
ncbi:uncharacterized protein LOC126968629 [Leptidea sinapis]|uniref:uncharacterized protein LOC126968629 n=1 Tax=Leptidea sinapis TaxID=189913 RepID=UPI0021C44149|nr:uncharacterized protein LOC126968629 [Leptidea sinapis]